VDNSVQTNSIGQTAEIWNRSYANVIHSIRACPETTASRWSALRLVSYCMLTLASGHSERPRTKATADWRWRYDRWAGQCLVWQ